MPVLKIKPTTERNKDELALEVASQVAAIVTEKAADLMTTVAEAIGLGATGDKAHVEQGRVNIRYALVQLYVTVLEEIDMELDGDDRKWRSLLSSALSRKMTPMVWAQSMKLSHDGARLNTGALDAYLAGDFDDEEPAK